MPPPSPTPVEKEMSTLRAITHPAVIVVALGDFVDIYDLTLFSIVRSQSLRDLGYAGEQLADIGLFLLNIQMVGMLVGGIVFGVIGDRVGRVALLFSSILLYSLANLANGFVQSVEAYAVLRFLAGLGLAGELGGCVTLVSEVLPKSKRGYGTATIATIGVLGAVFGEQVARHVGWRSAFFIGGGMGLALLALRVSVVESGLFNTLRARENPAAPGAAPHSTAVRPAIRRGDFLALLHQTGRLIEQPDNERGTLIEREEDLLGHSVDGAGCSRNGLANRPFGREGLEVIRRGLIKSVVQQKFTDQ